MQTRYLAEWLASFGNQSATEDFNPDLVEYGRRIFADKQSAIDFAHEHDLNSEGKVYIEDLVKRDDEGIPFDDWEETEAIYIFDDGSYETEDRGW